MHSRPTTEITVRGYHLDVFGHVNNTRYLEFLEEDRWRLFDGKINLKDLASDGFAFTVVNININYRQPAFLHDILTIETGMAEFGKRSAVLNQVVRNKKTSAVVADAKITFVMVEPEKQKAVPLDGWLKEQLLKVLEG